MGHLAWVCLEPGIAAPARLRASRLVRLARSAAHQAGLEREAGDFYRNLSFAIAVLAEDCGPGYVRHIGVARHVVEDRVDPFADKHSELPRGVEQVCADPAKTCVQPAPGSCDTHVPAQAIPRVVSHDLSVQSQSAVCGQAMVVQSLWIGETLSLMEKLSIQSFIACSYQFDLYAYQHVAGLPEGAVLRDANEIMPLRLEEFCYDGRPSPAAFADIFRLKL